MLHLSQLLSRHLVRFSCVDPHYVLENARLLLLLFRTVSDHDYLTGPLLPHLPKLMARMRYMCCNKLPGWRTLLPVLSYVLETKNSELQVALAELPPLFPGNVCNEVGDADLLNKLHESHEVLLYANNRKPNDLSRESIHFLQLKEVDSWALQHLLSLLSTQWEDHAKLHSPSSSENTPIVLRLAHRLSYFCGREDQTMEVRLLSARCLGMLQPSSLEYDLLKNKENNTPYWCQYMNHDKCKNGHTSLDADDDDGSLCSGVEIGRVVLISCLLHRLVSTDVELCKASSSVLAAVTTLPDLLKLIPRLSTLIRDQLKPLLLKRCA